MSGFTRSSSLAAVLALTAAAAGCYSGCRGEAAKTLGPARVQRIGGTSDPLRAFNVLIVGDGFTATSLPAFQHAAEFLTGAPGGGVFPPGLASKLNFFRVDVVDPTGAVGDATCPPGGGAIPLPPQVGSLTPLPAGNIVLPGANWLVKDFGAKLCTGAPPGVNPSEVLWVDDPSDQAALLKLATSPGMPPIDAVLVLAAVVNSSGGARAEGLGAGVGLVVMGVPWDVTVTPPSPSAMAGKMFVHELGHALGLYDEYDAPPGSPWYLAGINRFLGDLVWQKVGGTPVARFRNVWWDGCNPNNGSGCPGWSPGQPAPGYGLPWGITLAVKCDTAMPWPAGARGWVPRSLEVSCSSSGTVPPPALWEAAFYSRTHYYRSSHLCRMRVLIDGVPFCPACMAHLEYVAGLI